MDPSPEMLERARRRLPRTVALKRAPAERLPFRDGWFERATMTLVLHHTDPARALPEVRRVLGEGARLALLTFDPAQLAGYYLNEYFPSLLAVDTARFAPPERIEADLRAAGFADLTIDRLHQERTLDREAALEKIEGRHISTFQLIPEDEYEAGLERARRELPARIEYAYDWLVVVAAR